MRFALRFLSWNTAVYALGVLAPLTAHSKNAPAPEAPRHRRRQHGPLGQARSMLPLREWKLDQALPNFPQPQLH
jgi:hypothetical protein